MKYLIFDSSPISKPKNYSAPFSDTFSWPRMLHLSWIVLDKDFKPLEDYDCIIKPQGFKVDKTHLRYTHLSQEEVEKRGENIGEVLKAFNESVDGADYVFAHNLAMHQNIIAAEFIREGLQHSIFHADGFCLMQEATYFCKIPGKRGGYKWPSLTELHAILFKQRYSPANNARADVIAATRCFIMLMKVNALEDIFPEKD